MQKHTGVLCVLHALTSVITCGNVKLQLDCTVYHKHDLHVARDTGVVMK